MRAHRNDLLLCSEVANVQQYCYKWRLPDGVKTIRHPIKVGEDAFASAEFLSFLPFLQRSSGLSSEILGLT